MSNIEGDGIMEMIYYLLWRKDSPYNEQMNISIPDTVVFKKGRPINWYFTDSEGTMLKKKQSNVTYDNIIKKFTHKVEPGAIAGYFIHIDDSKKISKFMNVKSPQKEEPKGDGQDEDEDLPEHPIEYYDAKALVKKFKNGENCMDMNGILQKFIEPYGDHNELIQAIWSPRLCVFNKRVNLRRLNENHFDVYERAMTFDGPAFYSKNVPLRGGYIPGKLRATCDMIVQHIGHISFEKIIINRLVAYFKVDKKENVWFLWTTSIRVKETSKMHRNISEYLDKPLCLEPLVKSPSNVRLIQTHLSTRPANLQMNDQCAICGKKVTTGQLVPVQYKHLLGNDEILKRSEAHYVKEGEMNKALKGFELRDSKKPQQIKRNLIGVPVFIKVFHPEIGLKDYQILREKEHFLMQKTNVCDECFLIVSKRYQGGYPFKLTLPQRPKTANVAVKRLLQTADHDDDNVNVTNFENFLLTLQLIDERLPVIPQDEGIIEESVEESLLRTLGDRKPKPRSKIMKIDLEDIFSPKTLTASTSAGASRGMLKSPNSNFFTKTSGNQRSNVALEHLAEELEEKDDFESDKEGGSTTRFDDFTNLRSDILKALGGEQRKPLRAVQSAVGFKPQRPQSQGLVNQSPQKRPLSNNYNRSTKGLYSGKKPQSGKSLVGDKKYELKELNDLFNDSSVEGLIGLEENLLRNEMYQARDTNSPYMSQIEEEKLRSELMHELQAANRFARLEQKSRENILSRPATTQHKSRDKNLSEDKYIKNKQTFGKIEKEKRMASNYFAQPNYKIINEKKDKEGKNPRQKLSKTQLHGSMGNIGKDLDDYVEKMVSNRDLKAENADDLIIKNKKKLANIEYGLNEKYYTTINHFNKQYL